MQNIMLQAFLKVFKKTQTAKPFSNLTFMQLNRFDNEKGIQSRLLDTHYIINGFKTTSF